jgi:hypothetical protein
MVITRVQAILDAISRIFDFDTCLQEQEIGLDTPDKGLARAVLEPFLHRFHMIIDLHVPFLSYTLHRDGRHALFERTEDFRNRAPMLGHSALLSGTWGTSTWSCTNP